MALLKAKVQKQVKKEFEGLSKNVKLVVFTQEMECQYCRENTMLAQEVANLSNKISLEVYNFALDKEEVKKYQIDKIPAIVIEGEKDYGIRFYGIPAGYEFSSLIESIKSVSTGVSGLSQPSKEQLRKLDRPVHIQVFVTLTCPYCPSAVRTAHQLAIESDKVKADTVESAEFPHLIHKYNVFNVPKVIINETIQFEGALAESAFVEQVMKVMEGESK